jgi:hypothetical protein
MTKKIEKDIGNAYLKVPTRSTLNNALANKCEICQKFKSQADHSRCARIKQQRGFPTLVGN